MTQHNEDLSTSFGSRTVRPGEKQALVDEVFGRVAGRYDLMNDVMSAGLHRLWKSALVTAVNPPRSSRPFALLDVAGGTADIAMRVVAAAGSGTRATVVDISGEMLEVGRARAARHPGADRIDFIQGNAQALPLPDRTFDAYTIAFGIRNVPRVEQALSEAYRVLRPGGHFLCLEFSHVDVPGADTLYDLYSFNVIPALGRLVVGDGEPYRYLVESIRRFPKPDRFAGMIRDAGFARVTHATMTGGTVALHGGWRL